MSHFLCLWNGGSPSPANVHHRECFEYWLLSWCSSRTSPPLLVAVSFTLICQGKERPAFTQTLMFLMYASSTWLSDPVLVSEWRRICTEKVRTLWSQSPLVFPWWRECDLTWRGLESQNISKIYFCHFCFSLFGAHSHHSMHVGFKNIALVKLAF